MRRFRDRILASANRHRLVHEIGRRNRVSATLGVFRRSDRKRLGRGSKYELCKYEVSYHARQAQRLILVPMQE